MKCTKKCAKKKTFVVEVTEHYHKVFRVKAHDEQEASDIVSADCDKYDCTTGSGVDYSQEINHVYPEEAS